MADKYDEAVKYLTEHPQEIPKAWMFPHVHAAGCLFQFTTPAGDEPGERLDGEECGCLTSVKSGTFVAWTDELTNAIRSDIRLPSHDSDITAQHLPVFAEWQRRIDKELNRDQQPQAAGA